VNTSPRPVPLVGAPARIAVAVCALDAILLLCLLGGCAAPAVIGERAEFGTTKLSNPSPVTLHIEDADKQGTASGTGPARYTSIGDGRVETFQTGTVPRDFHVTRKPDGTIEATGSTGSDVRLENLKFDPKTGALQIGSLSTVTSEPLRAHNEAYDRLTAYWESRDEKSRAAILTWIDALKTIAPDFATLLRTALGVP
jgi:hypothetical protein